MIPRNRLDIGWADLLAGGFCCGWPGRRTPMQRRVEALWSPQADSIACLSVRSGFDLALQALDFPQGSEILMSAVTIPDMTRILVGHGLVPVPLDLDMATLAVEPAALERAISGRTQAILVAHLFGSRMPMEPIVEAARQHGFYLIEDCAQAYDGSNYRGHPESDITMFSFGPIKTATALGGGLLRIRDRALLRRMQSLQARYPVQRRGAFLRRVGKYAGLKLVTYPLTFRWLLALCRRCGIDYDELISQAVRSFRGSDLFPHLRQQPAYPLLALLARRLGQNHRGRLAQRVATAQAVIARLPTTPRPGTHAQNHTYWAFPIQASDPAALVQHLRGHGFDAACWTSSLHTVPPPDNCPASAPVQAAQTMAELLYLPVYPQVKMHDLHRLAHIIKTFENQK